MALSPGQVLQDRYVIQSLLHEGGMGAVYRALDRALNCAVAVKERLPAPNATPEALAQARLQFQREAQVLANLSHTNLPRVTNFFTFAGNEYLVMDSIEGWSLDDIVRQSGGQPEALVLAWADQLLDAVAYIHSRNVIHRDIKPANIILRPDGRVALVDFGLVKLVDPNDPRTLTVLRGMGTPEYAPFEQYASGVGHTDARSDIYSFGATLYHLLTGTPPVEVHQRMLNPAAQPAPRVLNPAISPQTEWVVLKAMEVYPQNRFQSAMEMRQALRAPKPERQPSSAQTAPVFVSEPAQYTIPLPIPTEKKSAGNWLLLPLVFAFGAICLAAILFVAGQNLFPAGAPPAPSPPVLALATATQTPAVEATATSTPRPTATQSPTRTPTFTTVPSRTPTTAPLPTAAGPSGMVFVPAGEFWMGQAPGDTLAAPDEMPGHSVYVKAFWIDKFEVSNGQFRKCVEARKCDPPSSVFSNQSPHSAYGNPTFDNFPVVFISQPNASRYCEWQGKRLPTEAEWEKAARGTGLLLWPWGNTWDGYRANAGKNQPGPDPVTKYDESNKEWNGCSPYGACNMAGNVAEWIGDTYNNNYYRDRLLRPPVIDPAYWGGSQFNVRGGSFKDTPPNVRTSKRGSHDGSDIRLDYVGVRCVKEVQ